MRQTRFRTEVGSAVFEFIVAVALGQVLVLAVNLQTIESLDQKVRLELAAGQLARAQGLGRFPELLAALEREFGSGEFRAEIKPCSSGLICVAASLGKQTSFGVSYQSAR